MSIHNSELDALVTALSVLRKIYSSSDIDDYGKVVIHEDVYPDIFGDILRVIGNLERVIASSLVTT